MKSLLGIFTSALLVAGSLGTLTNVSAEGPAGPATAQSAEATKTEKEIRDRISTAKALESLNGLDDEIESNKVLSEESQDVLLVELSSKREQLEQDMKAAEEAAKKKAEEEAKKKAEEEAAKKKAAEEAKKKEEEKRIRDKISAAKRLEDLNGLDKAILSNKVLSEENQNLLLVDLSEKKEQIEQDMKAVEEAAKRKAEEEAKRKAEEEAAKKKAEEEAKKKAAEEEAKKKAAEEAKKKEEEKRIRDKILAAKTLESLNGLDNEIESNKVLSEESKDVLLVELAGKREQIKQEMKRAEEEAKKKAAEEAQKKLKESLVQRIQAAQRKDLTQLYADIKSSKLLATTKTELSKMCDARLGDIEKLEEQMRKAQERKMLDAMIDHDKKCVLADIPVIDGNPHKMRGIDNFCNSCYFNAMLQQLYRYPLLREFLMSLHNDKSISELKTTDEEAFVVYYHLMKIFDAMDQGKAVEKNSVDVIRYIVFFKEDDFKNQRDAGEFCLFVLEKLGFNDRFDEYSVITEIGGKAQENKTPTTPVRVLSIGIKGENPSIQSCLNAHLVSETLDSENKFEIRPGEMVEVKKQICFESLPDTMMISLNRFNDKGEKILTPVELSEIIEVQKGRGEETVCYQLEGVICHNGKKAGSGHYISYVREGDSLHKLDDSDPVVKIADIKALQVDAYILRYRRIG